MSQPEVLQERLHPALELLKNRINLTTVPFTDRGSRFLLFRANDDSLWLGLAEYETPIQQTTVFNHLRFADATGKTLSYTLTSYPDRLLFETRMGTFTVAFVDADTLLIRLPVEKMALSFETRAQTFHTDEQSGHLRLAEERFLNYTTNAQLFSHETRSQSSAHHVRLSFEARGEQSLLLNLSNTVAEQPLPDVDEVLNAAKNRWQAWFEAVSEVRDDLQAQYYFAWWVMAVNLIRPRVCPHYEGMVPSKLGYVGIWHWDAYFHALALRHVDAELAKDQFRILLEQQLENGMIPDVVHDEGVLTYSSDMVSSDQANSLKYVGADSELGAEMMQAPITKPPLTAWAAWKVYETEGDISFLEEIYEPIARSQAWWFRENDTDGNGLPEYQHPYSSGIDDGPLWDEGPPVESPDLSSYLCLQYDHLAKMANVLGKDDEAKEWQGKAEQLIEKLIQEKWDEEAGLFWTTRHGKRITARTPFNLYPLITGRMPEAVADKLVATLSDEKQFWGRYPVPTVALDDPHFDPERMWRGPVWLNPNYLLIDGLFRAGYPERARALRKQTLSLITQTKNDMNEYYHPLTGEKPARATIMFGWTAALFIDLAVAESREHEMEMLPMSQPETGTP